MRTIALIIDTVGSYGRGLLSGVSRFVQTHIGWQVIYEERKGIDNLPKWLVRGSCEGILARVRDDRRLAALRRRTDSHFMHNFRLKLLLCGALKNTTLLVWIYTSPAESLRLIYP
jgi:hypothetical protein